METPLVLWMHSGVGDRESVPLVHPNRATLRDGRQRHEREAELDGFSLGPIKELTSDSLPLALGLDVHVRDVEGMGWDRQRDARACPEAWRATQDADRTDKRCEHPQVREPPVTSAAFGPVLKHADDPTGGLGYQGRPGRIWNVFE